MCADIRAAKHQPPMSHPHVTIRTMKFAPPTLLSTFSGLGGMDLGLEAAGFRSVGCVELDPVARRSLKANRGDDWLLLGEDVLDVACGLKPSDVGLDTGELTLLAGGPPCQPYSKAAMWAASGWAGMADPRALPLHGFLRLVRSFRPHAVLIENVPGFARGPRTTLPLIEAALAAINDECGTSYKLSVSVVDAADYGVPQHRTRCILVASRDGQEVQLPVATHRDAPATAWDAIGVLDDDEKCVATGKWARLLPSIPEGENYLWHTRKGGGLPLFGYRTRYWSFLLKLAKNKPAWTLPAQPGPSTGPFHWDNRPLTIKEMLRIQSFPSTWRVEGTRRDQVRQVGNAAPPLLCEVVGREILVHLGLAMRRAPTLEVAPRNDAPGARARRPVPGEFLVLSGDHADHPGAGAGPRPRLEVLVSVPTTGGDAHQGDPTSGRSAGEDLEDP
jgi:DNA (cytosine-5)-methyltransferase 1